MAETLEMMQGDAYVIGIAINDENGDPITDADKVEVTLGKLSKVVTYNTEDELWEFPVTQTETFSFCYVEALQVRVEIGGAVVGNAKVATVYVFPSNSKEVI